MPVSKDIYDKLVNDEDARLCRDIDESACRQAPTSFALLIASYFLTKLGDAIANPKTTLAWLTTAVGAPAWVLGMLVPIRESGSLIPQLFIGGAIRRLPVRKWVWVAGSVLQATCVAGMGLAALTLDGHKAGLSILALVVLFSLSRGLCSVASKDVLGKTIPKGARGQLNGWSASAAGLVTIAIGLTLLAPVSGSDDSGFIASLLLGAGGLWLLAAGVFSRLREQPGETGGGRSLLQALGKLSLLVTDAPFRRFVTTRALLMCSALSAPFYVSLAQQRVGSAVAVLGLFVVADGLASLVSAPVWGRFADRTSRMVMVTAALLTAATGIGVVLVDTLLPQLSGMAWFLPLAYFLLSVAHSGVRVGRKTYVVDLASGNQRTDYVAISNTVIGVLLLLVGSIGALTAVIGTTGVIALLSVMGLGGALLGLSLPEARNDE